MKAGAKILITGAGGQLGSALVRELQKTYAITAANHASLDICDRHSVERKIEALRPAAVLHCAAWTDVDACEKDPERAVAVNTNGARNVATVCARTETWMVYFSTDYVFDGLGPRPYREDDVATPVNVYGRSKLTGEEAVAAAGCPWTVIRTAWLYGRPGRNFVRSIVEAARSRMNNRTGEPLRVVSDQIGNPTWVDDLAHQVRVILAHDLFGRYHAAAHDHCSRYDLARAVIQELALPVAVEPCRSAESGRRAPRPAFSALDNAALKKAGHDVMRPYAESIGSFLKQERNT